MSLILQYLGLEDYNTRMVVLGTSMLGLACGPVGTFLVLRKRSLMSDALAHATLPGIAIAFLFSLALGGSGKEISFLLIGATIAGVIGCLAVLGIRSCSRIKDDAAMGIVLGVFFSAGVVLMGLIQSHPEGSSAGLMSFIYGKTASMIYQDVLVMAVLSFLSILLTFLFYKELKLLFFDAAYARSIGWTSLGLDVLLIGLVTALTVAGLQAVGLILIIAFLILPAASAQFLSHRLSVRMIVSAVIGALSGWVGSFISNSAPNLPAGAIIVLTASTFFALCFLMGPCGGVLPRYWRNYRGNKEMCLQHLLRAIYEDLEKSERCESGMKIPISHIIHRRTWTGRELQNTIKVAARRNWLIAGEEGMALTKEGFYEAERLTRNHRLWEIYLIEYADVARSHVDRDADQVEHVLGINMVRELEQKLGSTGRAVPSSPHAIE